MNRTKKLAAPDNNTGSALSILSFALSDSSGQWRMTVDDNDRIDQE
jgi:hypothetical protein